MASGRPRLRADALRLATRIAEATGATLLGEVFPTRWERGAGVPQVQRLAYLAEFAATQLEGFDHLLLVDAKAPVSFFAYPGKESYLVPDGCEVHELVAPTDDIQGTLEALADAVDAREVEPPVARPFRPDKPTGPLTADKVCQAIGAVFPERAIISDESNTSGLSLSAHTAGAPRHDVLTLTGGAIGQGLPVAVGAAVARPDRPVFALEGDGSAMYTIQSLWTMAREQLDSTVVIFNNRSYAILNLELQRVGAGAAGPKAKAQLDLGDTHLDFVQIGEGFGVPSVRVDTAEELNEALERAIAEPGPHLVEVVVPSLAI
ncbi:acetolactate synthase large subunit [Streptomyces sp. SA15]|uniref:acetolactate synthase large subunit n=1 Tax=Streptomyces sp. SA15 TaxID=934019 RepID=UPI00211C49A0|nr:acetolactate synthase large subunit [Streptomyces sp. SA15]